MDETGSGVIIFLEPVPKLFPRFGTGSPAYVFCKDIGQALSRATH
jgi:putative hemolysin